MEEYVFLDNSITPDDIGNDALMQSSFSVFTDAADVGDQITLDIVKFRGDEGVIWDDYSEVSSANQWFLNVSANQNKGTYLLVGNASAFDKTITVTNQSGTVLGTLSLADSVLDFDITRYTLGINENGVLTVTVSSAIDNESYFVFLYKNNQLVTHLVEGTDIAVSADGEYDHLVVIEDGLAGNIKLLSGGVVTVYSGGTAVGIEQSTGGKLRFDYTEGDTTIISGVNTYGTFFVQNDYLYNIQGENINLSGNVTLDNFHGNGVFTAADGVNITGVFVSGTKSYFYDGSVIRDCTVSGNYLYFEDGVSVKNNDITSGNYRYFNGGDFENVTISGSNNYFYGGTYGNVILNTSGTLYANITLDGTLTLKGNLSRYQYGSGYIDADGNTIVLDYTARSINDTFIVDGRYISEDAVFQIDLLADQGIGTYNILGYDRSDYSFAISAGSKIIGTLTDENNSFEYGNYRYTINNGKELVIDVSENADETFNVLYWNPDGTVEHSAELFTAETSKNKYKEILVRKNGIAGDITLDTGGLLEVRAGGTAVGINQKNNAALRFNYAGGDTTILSGVNQYGTFFVANDLLLNVIGETVDLSGKISVQDYHSTGFLTAVNGVAFSGILDTGSKESVFGLEDKNKVVCDVTVADAVVSGGKKTFYNGVTVTNSAISGGTNYFRGGNYDNTTVKGSNNYFYGGTFSDSTWQGGYVYKAVELAGTLTVTGKISSGGGVINANDNTIILDYTSRTVSSEAMLAAKMVSEDVVFQIDLLDDQAVGTYKILSQAGSFVDTFNISIAGDIIGTVNNENTSFDYGNFSYTMDWDNETQNITLTIDVSENADERFNVLCYDSNGILSYAKELTDVVIDGTNCAKITVRNGGWLANTKLQKGSLNVRKGATVFGIEQSASGSLNFDYASGDDTIISGVNQYGTFVVQNDYLINVSGGNVNVDGVTLQEYHSNGSFYGNNVTVTDNFYGSGSFENSTFSNADITGTASVYGKSHAVDTVFADVNIFDGYFENVTVNGKTAINGGSFNNAVLAGNGSVRGRVTLDGKLTLKGTIECVSSYSVNGAIDAEGHEINLDLTDRSPISSALINLDRVYNADLTITVFDDQTLGTYTLGTKAANIGKGDGEGYWDIDTNTWLYTSAVEGDLDGVVVIRSDEGIELARCTVNGSTEYFGRYNYTVYTDDKDVLQLRIGWNNKEDLTFAADGYDNDSFAKATKLNGNIGTLDKLTIDSASDVDYYKFTLDTAGRASSSIGIDFKMWKGDLDLYLYDSKGNLVDYAKSVTDNEVLSLHKLAAGDYYLKVSGFEGDTNEYTLNWNLPKVSTLQDATEKGNDKAHSYHLGKLRESVSVNAAISDANDEDYFMFILEKGMTSADSISITWDNAEADLEFYIYGSNGKDLIGRGVKTSDGGFTTSSISFAGFKHGVYYVRVVSADGGAVDYTLNANIGSADVNPDKWENNNSLKKASNLYALNGTETVENLSIHSVDDVDYFKFKILEDGSVDDYIAINYETKLGDLDIEILDADGNVVAYSRTAESTDRVSLNGLKAGEYYAKVSGYNDTVNNYTLDYHFTNSALIASDVYEGIEDVNGSVEIRQSQTISDLSIASVKREDETRADTFKITLDYDAWKSSKIILTDYRSDWEGLSYVLSTDIEGENIIASGISSEISLAGLKAGEYYLTVDTPVENQYSEYSVIAQHIPDSTTEIENTWSIFIYLAGDNNLEGSYLTELLYMQKAILPENVEVYVLMDRSEGYSVDQRNWTDTRVGKIRHSNGGAVAVEWMYFEGVDTDTYMNTSNLDQMQEWDTGSISTLEAFLDWGMKTGRADNYALIMKDHGTSLGWNSSDETSNSMMSITEISDLLSQDKYDDLSVVAFDQCLMGSDVVITEMENAVDYVVASEAVGWTPNLLMMYKVLFNSLETDMTAEEVAEKMVASCNCSGKLDLTLAAFDTSDTYLSTALNDFANNAKDFTYADWTALCTAFGTAFNYGDEICAFSDLISVLKEALNFTISSTLSDALTELISAVSDYVIKAAQITPAAYGNGLAVFNPVLSSDQMNQYYYVGGGNLDYYTSTIGQMAWGDFLYTVGKLAEDVSEFITESVGKLTFKDFDYYFGEKNKEIIINLGAFSGNGMTLEGLYVAETARFSIEMLQAGIKGDAIRIVADDPTADITISLVETKPLPGGEEEIRIRRTSTDGVLSLEGVDFASAGVYSDYELIISTDKATSFTMSFEAEWASGVDKFDFDRTGSIDSSKGGNNIADKATLLASGNYAGLMTYAGDADYYKLNMVYADKLNVTVVGSGLTVKEFDVNGNEVQSAVEADGKYTFKVVNGNYLYIEGNADISQNEVNAYTMQISDVESTYLSYKATELPTIMVEADLENITNLLEVKVTVSENAESYYSTDLISWIKFDGEVYLTQNGHYYFKAVDTQNALTSSYSSLEINNIDVEPPVLEIICSTSEFTNKDITLVAKVSDGTVEYFANSKWNVGSELTVSENGTYKFRVTDAVGNVTEKSVVVDNIDKLAPTLEISGNAEVLTNKDVVLTATASDGTIEYFANGKWNIGSSLTVTTNGTYTFRVTDAAGNVTEKSVVVDMIDKVAPTLEISGNVKTPTNKDVVLTATASDGTVEYFADGKWHVGNSITATTNGSYCFRVTDAAGNVIEKSVVVDKIDKLAPTLSISGNATVPTNKDVILTATASDGKIEYYDGNDWIEGNKLIVSANGTYQFRVTDVAGNVTEKSITVDMIDKVAPNKPTAFADITTATNGNVTVTATFSSDSVVKEYSLDNKNWKIYIGGINFEQNGMVYFRGKDEAGNYSTVTSYNVTNIDKVAPSLSISGNTTVPTNKNLILIATASDGTIEYFADGKWNRGNSITATENGTYKFRVTDEAGNITEKSVTVDMIDKVAPTLEISGNATAPTNKDVILTATVSDGTIEYFANSKWNVGNAITAAENGTYKFRVTDAAGNVTEKSVVVDKIDKVAPSLEISGNATAPTNQDVVLTATASDGKIEYYDGNDWIEGNKLIVSANGTYQFRVTDAAGNVTEKSVVVDKIDKVAPTLMVLGNVTKPTNNNIMLLATASDGVIEYLDGKYWRVGDSLLVAENGTYQFRVTDAAGNVTEKSVVVDMIDKIAPSKPVASTDVTSETKDPVTVSAEFSNDSTVKQYSFDNKTWYNYTSGVVMESNGTVYFRGIDAAGNISAVASYEVNNIIAASDIKDNDLDGNGLADVILVHTKQGYSGAWLTTGDSKIIKWGSLSDIKSGTEILGTGKLVGSADDGQDIFFADSKTVGAWNVVDGKVTGYKSIMSVNATTNVIGLGDFNGDGATDLLLRSTSGDLGFYGTDGTGWEYLIGLGKEWSVAAVGDLNGDGLADTIVRHDAGFAGTFLTQTDGTVKWANLDTLAKDMTIVGTGDFNGDGVDDVLLQKSNGWIGAWLVEDGSVDGFMGICTNKSAIEQIADFNGDGIDDLRVRDGKAVGVLYVNGADSTTWQYFQSVGTEWDTSFSALA